MDSKHFERLIRRLDGDISIVEEEIKSELARNIYTGGFYGHLDMLTTEKLCALYSAGYPIEDLKSLFTCMLYSRNQSIKSYTGPAIPLDCLAIGTLLGFSREDRLLMQKLLDGVARKDPFPAFLAACNSFSYDLSKPDKKNGGSWWKWFPGLRDMETNAEREEFLASYMKKSWYSAQRGRYWWNYHAKPHMTSSYFGYWAFEVAATVKAYGLDDASFANHRYYPKDLARYLEM